MTKNCPACSVYASWGTTGVDYRFETGIKTFRVERGAKRRHTQGYASFKWGRVSQRFEKGDVIRERVSFRLERGVDMKHTPDYVSI